MAEQLGIFDSGLERKKEGMAKAIDWAKEQWKEQFNDTVQHFADTRRPFTSEDVIRIVGLPRGEVSTNRNNAVGAMMNAAARRGVIRKTGRRVLSKRATSHGAELTEWVGSI